MKVVATTLPDVHSTNRHSWSAVAWIEGRAHVAPTAELDVYDRVGGGDGFAAGFIYRLLTGETPAEAVILGWAHGALLTTFPGDTTMGGSSTCARSPRAARRGFSGSEEDGAASVSRLSFLTTRVCLQLWPSGKRP